MRLPRLSPSVVRRSVTIASSVIGSCRSQVVPQGPACVFKSCQSDSDCAEHGSCTKCTNNSCVEPGPHS
jgi:hypothetical protein